MLYFPLISVLSSFLFKAMDLPCEEPFQWQIQDFPEEQDS